MAIDQALKTASKNLKRVLNSAQAAAILDKYEIGTWTAGGCYPLAMAVRKWLGRGTVVGLYSEDFIQHAAVEVDGYYIDGDGIATETKFLDRWTTRIKEHYEIEDELEVDIEIHPLMQLRRKIKESFFEHSARGQVDAIYELLEGAFPMRRLA